MMEDNENSSSSTNITLTVAKSVKSNHKSLKFGKVDDHLNTHLKDLVKRTHFTSEQIQALTKIYARLTASGKMDRLRFRDFIYSTFDITDDIVLDRMFNVFSEDSGIVSETQLILRLSDLTRGTLDEKIAYVFQLYDITGDNNISREEVDHFLRNCVSSSFGVGGVDVDEITDAVKDVGDIIFKKLDVDRNGLISFDDFYQVCSKDPLMLESLGQCLPSNKFIKSFLVLFADDYNNLDAGYSNKLEKALYQHPIPLPLASHTKGLKRSTMKNAGQMQSSSVRNGASQALKK